MQVDSRRKLPWLVLVALSSFAVAAVVLWILGRQPRIDSAAPETIEGPATTRVTVFGFYESATADALAELRDLLPTRVALVAHLAPPREMAAPPGGLGGIDVRWDRAGGVRARAERYGFDAAAVSGLGPARSSVLLAVLDRGGRVRGHYTAEPSQGGAWADPAVARASWLASLEARPLLHATLNGTSALLLVVGFGMIRSRRVVGHLACMTLAAVVTTAFLVSYLYYHYHAGSVAFTGAGWSRPLYFTVLITHVTLAALVVPLVVTLLYHAIRRRFARHRRLARWTLPIWLYVSVTGVLIYWMLYRWPT